VQNKILNLYLNLLEIFGYKFSCHGRTSSSLNLA
jgi:hypothetical protein